MIDQYELRDLERGIIEALLFIPDSIYEISDKIKPQDLNDPKAIEIFAKALSLSESGNEYNPIEITDSVSPEARNYIFNIDSTFVTKAHLPALLKKIKEYAVIRDVKNKMRLIFMDKNINAQTVLNELSNISQSIVENNHKDGFINIADTGEEIIYKNMHMGEMEGYSWGIKAIDRLTAGIIPGETYVIGGLKKAGKSKFLINTMYHLFNQDIKILFFSLEMGNQKVLRWIISRFSKHKISTDDFKFKNRLNMEAFINTISQINEPGKIFIDTRPGLSFMQIKNKIWKSLNLGIKVVFIDYLQRIYIDNGNDSRATAIQKMVGFIADMAKEYGVAIILLSQLSNVAEGHMATMGNLKESGGIAENVNSIFILNNIDRIKNILDPEKKTHQVYFTIEQRDGESGIVKCHTMLQYNEFYEEVGEDLL